MMFTRVHTLCNPEITIYAAIQARGVDLYFFKGNPADPRPGDAMAVIECVSEDSLIVAKIFDERQVGTTEASAMHTLVFLITKGPAIC